MPKRRKPVCRITDRSRLKREDIIMMSILLTVIVMAIFLAVGSMTVAFFARWIGYEFKSLAHNS